MTLHSLSKSNPNTFILAADGLLTSFQPEQDQVWEMNLESSNDAPFQLQTTFGLRARSMQLFVNILKDDRRLINEGDFLHFPEVSTYTPANIKLRAGLEDELSIQYHFFLPEPNILIGEVRFNNTGRALQNLDLEVSAILYPMGKGTPSRPEKEDIHHIIVGQTDDLWPVLFMACGPTAISSPYPALSLPIQVKPQSSWAVSWVLVTKTSRLSSLKKAQEVLKTPWQDEAAIQIMTHASHTIKISTGNADWDAAFSLAQTVALTHLVTSQSDKAKRFFKRNRLPDQAIITEKKPKTLDDFTTLELNHLAQVLLPSHIELLSTQVEKFLNRVDENGNLLARRHFLPFLPAHAEIPILANLTLRIYEINKDEVFISRVFPRLCGIIDAWLGDQEDAIPDQALVWDSPQQLQIDTGLFSFTRWEETGEGLDIQSVQSPALASILMKEVNAIKKLARILKDTVKQRRYARLEKVLSEKIPEFWVDEWQQFSYRDRDSKGSFQREILFDGLVSKIITIEESFTKPQRLHCRLISSDESTRAFKIQISGRDPTGNPMEEEFISSRVGWVMGRADLTTQNLYSDLNMIAIEGLHTSDQILLETVDHSQSDISCLLPVWTGHPSNLPNRKSFREFFNPQKRLYKNGIPETWDSQHELPNELPVRVNVLWNTLIIDGLNRIGFEEESLGLFSKLMAAMINGLKNYHGFFPLYEMENGRPAGQRNAIAGLAPLELFLQIVGVKLFSPDKIAVWGVNPFPWPVEVHWQGLSIRRKEDLTSITFPDGTTYESNSQEPVMIEPSKKNENQ